MKSLKGRKMCWLFFIAVFYSFDCSANDEHTLVPRIADADSTAMQIVSVQQFQPSTPVGIGAHDEGLVRLHIKTQGGGHPITVNKFSFIRKEAAKDLLKNFAFYTCQDVAKSTCMHGNQKASLRYSSDSIIVDGEFILQEGDNYFWLAADIHPEAKEGQSFCAILNSYATGEKTIHISNTQLPEFRSVILHHEVLFYGGLHGSNTWRIPAMVAEKNHLVTVADARIHSNTDLPNNIDLVARTSHDDGKTWSAPKTIADFGANGASDPALVFDRTTGDMVCIFASHQGLFQSTPQDRIRIQLIRSIDMGESWSEPIDISDQIYQPGWHAAWIASGSMHQMRDGTLLAVAGVRASASREISNYMIYSRDGGNVWSVASGKACDQGDEAKIVSLENGAIMMLVRTKGKRRVVYSYDMGQTWSLPVEADVLIEPAVNGDLIRYTSVQEGYDKNRLLFAIASHPSERKNLTVFTSYDEGKQWNPEKVLHSGLSAYAALCALGDGTIGLLYENGSYETYQLCFARFTLDWLTSGRDKWIAPYPAKR
jgi:hypothetical protein